MRRNAYIRLAILFSAGIWLLQGCAWKQARVVSTAGQDQHVEVRSTSKAGCTETENYIPHKGRNGITPLRMIRLNFHFMNSADGTQNLGEEEAREFAEDLVKRSNKSLRNNQPMRLPQGNNTPVLDPLLQYKIVRQKNGEPAIFVHYDDDHYYLIKKGKYQNNYRRDVIDKYGTDLDSVLNVFVQVLPPDSLMPADYGGLLNGVALRNSIKISGHLTEGAEAWQFVGMFNHEIGHILGLRHSWIPDQCEDTPEHANCWNYTDNGSVCDSLVSNNVMDSNASQNALTPCQIGIMQSNLTKAEGSGRAFIDRDFCRRDVGMEPHYIKGEEDWCMEKDVTTDVLVERGARLVISSRISMARGTGIYVRKGGKLKLKDGTVLHNECGYEWGGVFMRSGEKDRIEIGENVRIENVVPNRKI